MAWFAVLTGAWGGEQQAPAPSVQVESLCSVFAALPQLAGRVVAIRAEWHAGDEQFFLASGLCSDRFEFLGRSWPRAIQLRFPGSPETPSTLPAVPERDSLARFDDVVKAARRKGEAASGCVTVVGLLSAASGGAGRAPLAAAPPRGFGHLGGFVAQVTLLAVREVDIGNGKRGGRAPGCGGLGGGSAAMPGSPEGVR